MNPKIICAGHICIDITPIFDGTRQFGSIAELLNPGSLIYMHGANIHPGGSVANTGLAMKFLGNNVELMGKVGRDIFGRNLRDILASYGVSGLIEQEDSSTSYSVVLAIPGYDRIFLHDPGANDTFSAGDIPWDRISDTALFHFGYPPLMKQMYADNGDTLSDIFRRLKAQETASSLDLAAVDPQSDAGKADWERILAKTLPFVDFFEPSFEELCFMLERETWQKLSAEGGDMTDALDLQKYAKPLADKCIAMGCKAVLIKCGMSGMYWKTADSARIRQIGKRVGIDPAAWAETEGIQRCYQADIVRSGSGAGDVSIAAFLTAMLHGETPSRCAMLAAAEGAASVSAYDALSGLLPLDELSSRIDAGWETKE